MPVIIIMPKKYFLFQFLSDFQQGFEAIKIGGSKYQVWATLW
jgi:hypothetical protein